VSDRDGSGASDAGGAASSSTFVDVAAGPIDPEEILVLRRGPGANCSSIGSALDVLFLSATLAGVILVSVAAAMGDAKEAPARHGKRAEAPPEAKEAGDADAG
jgi:hypothetical protein